jgi:hypothetical protein
MLRFFKLGTQPNGASSLVPTVVSAGDPLPVTSGTGASATQVQGAAADGDPVAGSPVRIGGKDGSGNTQDIATDTSGNVSVIGSAASGATDSGNPVKVGGVFNTTPPTLTSGQRGDAQMDVRGNLKAMAVGANATGADGISAALVYIQGNADGSTLTTRPLAVAPHVFNGTTQDRVTKANATSRIASAAATTNATSAKAAAGNIHTITGFNAAGSVRYLKIYNKASAPTVGTDVPVMTIAIPAGQSIGLSWLNGYFLSTGIAYALTTGAADADTGALTLADVVGLNITYS